MLAYLDANSGSLIASAIAGGAAGVAVVAKMGWRRTLGALSPKKGKAGEATDAGSVDLEAGAPATADDA